MYWCKVVFTPADLLWQHRVALARQQSKGTAAIDDRKRIDPKHTTWETNLLGVSCEHAVSRLVPRAVFDWEPHPEGDGGVIDFLLDGFRGQVKGTWTCDDRCHLYFNPGDFKADVAVLVAAARNEPHIRSVVGWMLRGPFEKATKGKLKNWGYGDREAVHWKLLHDIAYLT